MSGGNFKLGLFVTVAVVLLVGFLLTLGAIDRFKPHVNAETYFLESIQTLQPGAAVRFRGVGIGTVDWVGFVATHYPEATERPGDFRSYIMVSMKLDSAILAAAGVDNARERIERIVEDGVRARLSSQGLGGPTFVEIDYADPAEFPPPTIVWTPKSIYIPSAPSTVHSIIDGLASIMRRLEEFALIEEFAELGRDLRRVLGELEASDLVATSDSALEELRAASAEARSLFGDPRLDQILGDASASLKGARALLDTEGGELESLVRDMSRMAATLERAGTSLDTLAVTVNESGLIAQLQSLAEELGPAGHDLADLAARLDRFVKGNENQIADAIRSIRDAALELETMLEDLKANPSRILADPPPKGTPGGGS